METNFQINSSVITFGNNSTAIVVQDKVLNTTLYSSIAGDSNVVAIASNEGGVAEATGKGNLVTALTNNVLTTSRGSCNIAVNLLGGFVNTFGSDDNLIIIDKDTQFIGDVGTKVMVIFKDIYWEVFEGTIGRDGLIPRKYYRPVVHDDRVVGFKLEESNGFLKEGD